MLNLVFVSPVAEAGGSDQALLRLIRSLASAHVRANVVLPGHSPLEAEFLAAGAELHVIPMRRLTSNGGARWWLRYAFEWPLAVLRLTRLARRVDADLISTNSLHSWYGWAAAALLHTPHVWHAREIVAQSAVALRLERRLIHRFADRLVACSHAVADQFAGSLPNERISVVHEDVDRGQFNPGRVDESRSVGPSSGHGPRIGFVGRIDTWKGLDVLLDAWPEVLRHVPTAQLLVAGGPVVGKTAYFDSLRARSRGIPQVNWLGHVYDVAPLMASLDIVVAPSTLPEPYGLNLVEALASGARVVACSSGGPPEIVAMADPGAGDLVRPNDANALSRAIIDLALLPARPRRALIQPFPTDWAAIYHLRDLEGIQ